MGMSWDRVDAQINRESRRLSEERKQEEETRREAQYDRLVPLTRAIRCSDPDATKEILEKMTIEERRVAVYATDYHGCSALFWALKKDSSQFLKILNEYIEIDVNFLCKGNNELASPLYHAIKTGSFSSVQVLLSDGASLKTNSNTPLLITLIHLNTVPYQSNIYQKIQDLILNFVESTVYLEFRSTTNDPEITRNHFRKELLKFCGLPENLLPDKPPTSFFGWFATEVKEIFTSTNENNQKAAVNLLEKILQKFNLSLNQILPFNNSILDLIENYCNPKVNNAGVKLLFSNFSSRSLKETEIQKDPGMGMTKILYSGNPSKK